MRQPEPCARRNARRLHALPAHWFDRRIGIGRVDRLRSDLDTTFLFRPSLQEHA